MSKSEKPNHAMLLELWELAENQARTRKEEFAFVFDHSLGLILHRPLKHGGYWCTPTNTLMFAETGGEGVHFSFLLVGNTVTDRSPVVMTAPSSGYGEYNFILGENFYEFLCLGMHRGYFALEQLGLEYETTIKAYSDPHWMPTESWHNSVGFGVDEDTQRDLNLFVERFSLTPWKDVRSRLEELEAKFRSWLQIPSSE